MCSSIEGLRIKGFNYKVDLVILSFSKLLLILKRLILVQLLATDYKEI